MGASGVAAGVITSELYVCLVERQWMSYRCSPSALQADSRPIPTTGGRGAGPSRRCDGISQRKTRQNAFVVRYRGILRLADCFQWLQAIRFGYSCAYARHTPHAQHKNTLQWVWGGVAGYGCCAWLSARDRAATLTKKIPSKRGGGGRSLW